jgi:hypothetical protein
MSCRGAEPPHEPAARIATVSAPETPETPSGPLRRRAEEPAPVNQPRIRVQPVTVTPEPGDRDSAKRKLAQCCAELERLANTAPPDETKDWLVNAFECIQMRDDPHEDPRKALGLVRIGLSGIPIPAACR